MDVFEELGFGSEEKFIIFLAKFMIMSSSIVFLTLLFIPGKYGRFSSPKWGPALDAKVAWVMQEMPSVLIPTALVVFTNATQLKNPANKIIVCCMILHYFQRSFIYPFLIRGGKPWPYIMHLLALAFCTVNGYVQGRWHSEFQIYDHQEITNVRFITGIAIYLCGLLINLHSDHILRNLRRPGETGYKIPVGGMFNYVSTANYFGECTEWIGYAIAAWTLPALAFALFTLANLVPRALAYHKNYLQKFDNYPRSRKAIFPFLL